MKIIHFFVFISLFLAQNFALSQTNAKPDFSWDSSGKYESFEKVRFENGAVAIVISDQKLPQYQRVKEECAYKRLEIGKEGNRFITNACDGQVNIRAAFPSVTNAKVAIVETNCGGTMCNSFNDLYIVFLNNDRLEITKIGTSFYGPKGKTTTYEFWFDGKKIKRSLIRNFYDGKENNLGDLIPSTRIFVPQGAYLDSRFKKEFEQFIGEHPDSFMGNSSARTEILKFVKPEEFREYRNAMSGPGSSTVANGRFIVMNACMAHNCNDIFGSAVIDGFTGHTQLIRFEKSTSFFRTASTKELDPEVDYKWIEDVDTQNWAQISIKAGKLVASKNKN
jgi:hypothetical protein